MIDLQAMLAEVATAAETGQWEKAANIYAKLEKACPGDASWSLRRGECLRKGGNPREAMLAFKRALGAYMQRGLRAKAIATCKMMIELDGRDPRMRELLEWLQTSRTDLDTTPSPDTEAPTPGPAATAPVPSSPPAPDELRAVESACNQPIHADFAVPSSIRRAERTHADPSTGVKIRVVLPRTPVLSTLSEQQLRVVNERARLVGLEPGEILFNAGDPSETFFIVASGEIAMLSPPELARLHKGDVLGEEAVLLPDQPRAAGAHATVQSQVLALDPGLMRELIASSPGLLDRILDSLRDRLVAAAVQTYPVFAQLGAEDRAETLSRFRFRAVDKDERIFEEGETSPGPYVMLAGEAAGVIDGMPAVHLLPGDVFGELSLVTGKPLTATFVALKKSFLLHLPRADFDEIVTIRPQLLAHLAASAESRMRALDDSHQQSAKTIAPEVRTCMSTAVPMVSPGRVLIADDDPEMLRVLGRILAEDGYLVERAANGKEAADRLAGGSFDLVLSDINMPEMDGIELLRAVRRRDLDVPVILITGIPNPEMVTTAMDAGALHCFGKPVQTSELLRAAEKAVQMHRLTRLKREALACIQSPHRWMGDRIGLEHHFSIALDGLWMAYQPIVNASAGQILGYEAFLRSTAASFPGPAAMIDGASRLRRVHDLGRTARERIAMGMAQAPPGALMFVNLHSHDLLDEHLVQWQSPLSRVASRVILEITERDSLEEVDDLRARAAALRDLGFRLAVDSFGAGHASLLNLAHIEPEIVKLDMSLVRDIDKKSGNRELVRSILAACRDMRIQVVCGGVETIPERDSLVEVGCSLMQGYLFARPAPTFPSVDLALLRSPG